MQRVNQIPTLGLVVCVLSLTGCPFDSDSSSDNNDPPEFGDPEIGVTFTNLGNLLAPWAKNFGESYGGVAWLDYDRDGDLDLYLTNSKNYSSALMRNNGDGTFTDVTIAANATVMTGSSGIVVGDIDNDGYPDIFLSGSGYFSGASQSATVLLHNLGPDPVTGVVTFEDISSTAGVPGAETALSAAMGDINNDGYLDLFITSPGHLPFGNPPAVQHEDRLYLNNNGDLTFTDITDSAGVAGGLGSCAASFSHFDDDEFIDLFVAVCNDVGFAPTPWHVYKNNGDNTFTDVAASTGLDLPGFWMSSTFGDIDNDGDFDIFSTNLGGGNLHRLWRNNGDGTYVSIASDEMGRNLWAWGATFADFDNDGFQDLFYGGESPTGGPNAPKNPGYLFFNNGDSRFRLDNDAFGVDLAHHGAASIAKADYDGDGFVDFLVMTSPTSTHLIAEPFLMHNNGNGNNSLSIRLEGTTSNRMAIGARVEIISNADVYQAREIWAGSSFVASESQWPVFGLGQATEADATVYWPSGLVESFDNLDAGELHHLVEGTGK
jgi:hypothetical protein